MSTQRQRILRALRGEWATSGYDHPRMHPWDRVRVAERARALTGLRYDADPRDLAIALGLRVGPARVRCCGGEVTADSFILYEWSPDRQERGLRVLHGIAHVLLRREKWDHAHADVLLLSGDLAVPRCELARDDAELERTVHAPTWFTAAWLPQSRKLGSGLLRVA